MRILMRKMGILIPHMHWKSVQGPVSHLTVTCAVYTLVFRLFLLALCTKILSIFFSFYFLFLNLSLVHALPHIGFHTIGFSWVECLCSVQSVSVSHFAWRWLGCFLTPQGGPWSTLLSRLHPLHWWWWLWRIASIFPLGGIMKSIIFIAFMERWYGRSTRSKFQVNSQESNFLILKNIKSLSFYIGYIQQSTPEKVISIEAYYGDGDDNCVYLVTLLSQAPKVVPTSFSTPSCAQ